MPLLLPFFAVEALLTPVPLPPPPAVGFYIPQPAFPPEPERAEDERSLAIMFIAFATVRAIHQQMKFFGSVQVAVEQE
jgi:hypothetical protein